MKWIAFFEVHLEDLEDFIEKQSERIPVDPKIKILHPPHTLAEPYGGITGFVIFKAEIFEIGKIREYLTKHQLAGADVKLFPIWEDSKLAKELVKFREGKREAELQWNRATYPKMTDLGSTKSLEILPLIDWHKERSDLEVETGVAYLIKTDECSFLFDLGLNSKQEDPSPLLRNMERLRITLDDFDTIVISHNHGDHTGGSKWSKNKTFSLTAHQMDLAGKTIYTPIPMTYPGLHPICSETPTIIARGVATIGTISSSLFLFGLDPEQAIAVNVEGKGIVLIVGCGHQTIPKLIERSETLFDEPFYGLIGGLHYPVSGGPFELMGMSLHKHIGTGKLPWRPLTMDEVQESIDLLKKRAPKVIGLSAHDSCKASMEAFRNAFPNAYRDIKVGKRIEIGTSD